MNKDTSGNNVNRTNTKMDDEIHSSVRIDMIRSMKSTKFKIRQKVMLISDPTIPLDRSLVDRNPPAPSRTQSARLSSLFCGSLVPRI